MRAGVSGEMGWVKGEVFFFFFFAYARVGALATGSWPFTPPSRRFDTMR